MIKEPISILRNLASDYSEGKISALVGAGFSKNVSLSYLNWNELLIDMYKDVYSEEIEIYYQNYLHHNAQSTSTILSETDAKNEYVKRRLASEDLLLLVSKYIKRKGYREAVDIYIEERTPKVSKDNNKIALQVNDNIEVLKPNVFSAHQELLKCDKFLNLYTTNYDNLLEFTNKQLLDGNKYFAQEEIVTSERLSDQVNKKNIIKIHGSLRNDDDSFGFDGDNNLCYIIAQEDYDTYLEKHEAFSYMMRIAMLSGKFCLLGFSGTDANYLAWLKWMRDIVIRNPNNDTKIYLISIDNKSQTETKEQILFNKNYHIDVLYLLEDEVLEELGFEENRFDEIRKNKDYRTVITSFLRYLRTGNSNASENLRPALSLSESTNETDDKLAENLSESYTDPSNKKFTTELPRNNQPSESLAEKSKENLSESFSTSTYKKLWLELSDKIQNKESIENIAKQIFDASVNNRICKVIYPQERIITSFERRTELSETEAKLFALSVKEAGLLPCCFDKINNNEELRKTELWQYLIYRNNTISGDLSIIEGEQDAVSYENLLRSLFALDFSSVKSKFLEWQPNKFWIQHHSMIGAMYLDLIEESRNDLKDYINDATTPTREKLFASNIGNYISGVWFNQPYDCNLFYEKGFDGLGDIQANIVKDTVCKVEKPQTLGWIGTSIKFGEHSTKIRKSIKLLTFILESGINVNYYGTYFLSIENWYVIAHNLLRYFPYPCFYYSCQYQDKNVLRRIGQEFAFNKSLQTENEDLLIKSLIAIGNPDTPELFLTGLHILSGRLYMCIDEEKWFDLFKTNIAERIFSDFANNCSKDDLFENFRMAVGALKSKEHIDYVFKNILLHFNEDPENALSVICRNLDLHNLGTCVNEETEKIILSVISNADSQKVFELIYNINEEINVGDNAVHAALEKMKSIPEDALSDNLFVLMNMLLFAKNDEVLQKRIRPKFLQTNMWHCGLMDDGKGYSNPQYIRFNLLQDKIIWSDEEFNYIAKNLEANINKFKPILDNRHSDSFMRSERIQYFNDVKQYISGLSENRKTALSHVFAIVSGYIDESENAYSFENELLSQQPADVSNALKTIEAEINLYGLQNKKDEFELVLDRALLIQELALKTNLGTIHHIVLNHFEELKELGYINKILTILRIYKQKIDDFQDMDIDIYWVFNHIHGIAKKLQENNITNDLTDFWLTDNWVLTFARFHK